MSTINTNGIDVNYPVPGQNNSSQGFRNNFTAIRQNLNIAGSEISDLQNKVVLKSALANSTLNNDMANTLIANASTLQFRATTYNLGNALVGTVLIDCTLGDVQYGNVDGNITLDFGSWIPTNTQGGIELQIGRANANVNYNIFFPSEAVFESRYGWPIIENSVFDGNTNSITFPNDLLQINLKLYSNDCGNTIFVQPINRPFKSTQIQSRTPPSTGQLGDVVGTVYVDPGTPQLPITGAYWNGVNPDNSWFTTTDTSTLTPGLPLLSTGPDYTGTGLGLGTTSYVKQVINNTQFTLSFTEGGPNISVPANITGNGLYINPVQYMYVAVENFNADFNVNPLSINSTTSPNLITLNTTTLMANNQPVIFYGSEANLASVGLSSNTVYYIKNYWSGNNNITVSEFRYNGVAGLEYQGILTVANASVDCRTFQGSDIFRRIPLQPF